MEIPKHWRRATLSPPLPASEQEALGHLEDMVAALRGLIEQHDDEAAHVQEDATHVEALQAIVRLSTDRWARLVAKTALETAQVDFDRWSA